MPEPRLPDGLGPVDGFGMDVEALARWRQLVADDTAWPRLARSFTVAERRELETALDLAAAAASRWVAKEAVVKALAGGVGLREVEVLRDPAGGGLLVTRPTLAGARLFVSVSHTDQHTFGAAWVGTASDGRSC